MQINLKDGSFPHQQSAGLGNDCTVEAPRYFTWDRLCSQTDAPTFYTDQHLLGVKQHQGSGKRIGWLIEPPSLHDGHYKLAWNQRDDFDTILTFDRSYIERDGARYKWYPFGGSWIPLEKWGLFTDNKRKLMSLIATQKTGAVGHKLRHEIAQEIAGQWDIDVWGRGYRPFGTKIPMLRPYRYTIVVESCRLESYFSEKLIDALSQGCAVLYWGCPNIHRYFSMDSIIPFKSLDELEDLIDLATVADYESRLTGITYNQRQALKYRCCEDWIWQNCPELFR